jgi:flagellar protein FlbD
MIELHRLQHQTVFVNPDLIEFIESTPDTLISLTTGKKLMVLENVDEIIQKIVDFRKRMIGTSVKSPGKKKSVRKPSR